MQVDGYERKHSVESKISDERKISGIYILCLKSSEERFKGKINTQLTLRATVNLGSGQTVTHFTIH
jgi:hypothetical protein